MTPSTVRPVTRRTILAGAGGLSIATILAACTGQSDGGGGGGGGGGGDEQSLTFWMDAFFATSLTTAVAGFQEEFGVALDIQPTEYSSIIGAYQQGVPAGSGPDLADFNIDHIGPLFNSSLVQALDFGDKLSSLDPRAVSGYTVDGRMYGLPLVIESTNFWRNPDLVGAPAATWDDVANTARGLVGTVEYPFVIDLNAYVFQGMAKAFGGYVFAQNADGSYDVNDVGLDAEGTIAAMEWIATGVREGWLTYGLESTVIGDAWAGGQIGMHSSGPWQLASYKDGGGAYAIDTIPAGPVGPAIPWLSARGLVVNPESANAALAATFLTEFMTSDEPMAAFATATSKQSTWLPVQESAADEDTAAFATAGINAQPIPQNAELASYFPSMDAALLTVAQGTATPADAAANVAQQFRTAVASAEG